MTAQLPAIALDFETFYTKEYSLTKVTPVHYVLDPKFEVIGFAYAEDGQRAHWFSGTHAETKAKLESLQLDQRTVVCHNSMFDGSILEWQFGIRPLKYFCTMMGSRPFITPFTGSMSLAKGAEYLELAAKGNEVAKVIDKRRLDFTPSELREYGAYCINDVNICMAMYHFILARMPDDEVDLVDLTIKKFTRGKLTLDRDKLLEAQEELADAEAKAMLVLAALGVTRQQITSNPQLATLLKSYGVEPPQKISPADPNNTTWAFAKKDPEFLALKAHPDPRVQQIVEARLLLKSSIERTRVQQFLELERLHDRLPVPLLYYGAHTGRFSGLMGINLQNLPRGSALRKSVIAPPGYKVISADLSAIEARITAVLAGQWDLVDRFAHGADVYSEFATELYGYSVSDDPETFTERFVGKMCILGLGFGMGPGKFNATMGGMGIPMDEDEAMRIVGVYRKKFRCIPALWRKMDACVAKMIELQNGLAWYGFPDENPMLTFKQKQVILPNGMPIFYPQLCRDTMNHCQFQVKETPSKVYWKPLWGGSLTENVVQAMARIILSRAELRLARAGLEAALQVHDELVYVVPEAAATRVADAVKRVLTDPVPWMPKLPLACKVGIGNSYGETK